MPSARDARRRRGDGGRCGLMQTVEEPGAKPPRHLHHREDETLYVIEGSLSMWVAGR